MQKSKSFWYFLAALSGLCAVVCCIYGAYVWASVNVLFCFWDLALSTSAPNP